MIESTRQASSQPQASGAEAPAMSSRVSDAPQQDACAASRSREATAAQVSAALASLKTGLGFDVHAFAEGRKLILGGVDIPHDRGLLGHSDADVLAHAISDALLGAVRGGDIGKLFPDTDPAYKDADSLKLLAAVAEFVRSCGFEILDVDSVIAAQAPKLSPYRDAMRENLARAMGVAVESVGVKATTTEWLGFEGREEGISARAVCLVCRCSGQER